MSWYSSHDEMFPNQSFSSIPVEVYSGVTNTRKVDTGWSGDNTCNDNVTLCNEVVKEVKQ